MVRLLGGLLIPRVDLATYLVRTPLVGFEPREGDPEMEVT
jgi:hypothetical protein